MQSFQILLVSESLSLLEKIAERQLREHQVGKWSSHLKVIQPTLWLT